MTKLNENTSAPDFILPNFDDVPITLSDYQGQKHVVLVFNRGFM